MIPKRWYSPDLSVIGDLRTVADIDASWWRERGTLTMQESSTVCIAKDC